jgi:hypothetical protein
MKLPRYAVPPRPATATLKKLACGLIGVGLWIDATLALSWAWGLVLPHAELLSLTAIMSIVLFFIMLKVVEDIIDLNATEWEYLDREKRILNAQITFEEDMSVNTQVATGKVYQEFMAEFRASAAFKLEVYEQDFINMGKPTPPPGGYTTWMCPVSSGFPVVFEIRADSPEETHQTVLEGMSYLYEEGPRPARLVDIQAQNTSLNYTWSFEEHKWT